MGDQTKTPASNPSNVLSDDEREILAKAVQDRGASAVAKELDVPRTAIVAVLAKVARRSTETAVSCRLARLANGSPAASSAA